MESWRYRASVLKKDSLALYLAMKDPRVQWYTRLLAGLLVFYVFSPIDLIPDFIPVLGYLDDIIVVLLGFSLVIKLIPAEVMQECREEAGLRINEGQPVFRSAAVAIILFWLVIALIIVKLVLNLF